jgi:hypothetical protein
MKTTTVRIIAALVAGLGFAPYAHASPTMTYTLLDIGNFAGYSVAAVGQTFSGTGFVGEYSGNQFGHLFGLEGSSSMTNAQIDLSGLSGMTIIGCMTSRSRN